MLTHTLTSCHSLVSYCLYLMSAANNAANRLSVQLSTHLVENSQQSNSSACWRFWLVGRVSVILCVQFFEWIVTGSGNVPVNPTIVNCASFFVSLSLVCIVLYNILCFIVYGVTDAVFFLTRRSLWITQVLFTTRKSLKHRQKRDTAFHLYSTFPNWVGERTNAWENERER